MKELFKILRDLRNNVISISELPALAIVAAYLKLREIYSGAADRPFHSTQE